MSTINWRTTLKSYADILRATGKRSYELETISIDDKESLERAFLRNARSINKDRAIEDDFNLHVLHSAIKSALFDAVKQEDVQAIQSYLNNGGDPNFRIDFSTSLIGTVVHQARPKILKILLAHKEADPNRVYHSDGWATPMTYATGYTTSDTDEAKAAQAECLKLLLADPRTDVIAINLCTGLSYLQMAVTDEELLHVKILAADNRFTVDDLQEALDVLDDPDKVIQAIGGGATPKHMFHCRQERMTKKDELRAILTSEMQARGAVAAPSLVYS